MELLEATAADVDALVQHRYALASAMEAYSTLNELVYADVEEVPEAPFRDRLDDPEFDDYLVVHDDETVGYVMLREGAHPSREYSRYLRIVDLTIDERRRSQGHGTAVVERVKELARERGCVHLTVSCEWANEGAREFYRDAGFRPKQVEFAQPLE